MTGEDRQFVARILKMDPRERPTARELLKDEWFGDAE
jgi:casein kinase II subunit alpha